MYGKDLDKALQKKRMVIPTICFFCVFILFIDRLNHCTHKIKINLQLSSSVQIVDFLENDKKDKNNPNDYCYMPETYNECKDRFGVIFCNNLKVRACNVVVTFNYLFRT